METRHNMHVLWLLAVKNAIYLSDIMSNLEFGKSVRLVFLYPHLNNVFQDNSVCISEYLVSVSHYENITVKITLKKKSNHSKTLLTLQ